MKMWYSIIKYCFKAMMRKEGLQKSMNGMFEKLKVLTDSAKFDVACTSSGSSRKSGGDGMGSASLGGICHSFAADGRCISLLKVLLSNACVYNCEYCVNRRENDIPRATFTPRELADLTMNFYKRNYIEGLFLSSGIVKNPDYTVELMVKTLRILREEYRFYGYIHAKGIPGASASLLYAMGLLVDRMSVNIELPSNESLNLLAPDKSKHAILKPMGFITSSLMENKNEIVKYRHAPKFVPAGQSTQMIIGATPETDYHILNLSEALYKKYRLKRVFYSAYMPVGGSKNLPSVDVKPPLLREHRLYQADWLLRFYSFSASEILDEENQNFNPYIDPKCNWALHNMGIFPLEINKASHEELLRVPGIGVRSAERILYARRAGSLDFDGLKKLGVVMKRAKYFITCRGRLKEGVSTKNEDVLKAMMSKKALEMYKRDGYFIGPRQLDWFDDINYLLEDHVKCLTGEM